MGIPERLVEVREKNGYTRKRLAEELDWFADKFDYRFKDAPWKNSKDSIPRAMIKTIGIMEIDDKKKKD